MALEDNERSGKRNNHLIKISLTASLTAGLFIIEVYEIMNDPHNLAVIGVLGVFILAAVIAETIFIDGMVKDRSFEQKKIYHDIYRSEKASYLLMKKYFDQIDRKIDEFVKQMEIPYKELFAAQKALAKIQINKNKANADALLISNEKMLHKISSFQKEMSNAAVSDPNEKEEDSFDRTISQLLEKQQEIAQTIKEMEHSLRDEISKSSDKINTELNSRMNSDIEFKMEPISSFDSFEQETQKADQTIQMPAAEESELHPLDIEEDMAASISNEQKSEPISSSTESELDKLLMGMDPASGSAVHQEESLHPEPVLGPIGEEPVLETIAAEPALKPISAEPVSEEMKSGPIAEEPPAAELVLGPIGEEPVLTEAMKAEKKPVLPEAEKAEEEPALEKKLGPVLEEPVLESILEEPKLETVIEEPVLKPISEETKSEKILKESELKPSAAEPKLESAGIEPELKKDSVKSKSALKGEKPVFDFSDSSRVMTSDEISAMIDNTEKKEQKEVQDTVQAASENVNKKTEEVVKTAENLKQNPQLDQTAAESKEPDLEQIMKEMNIEHILDEPLEDIDIDKILEKPPADLKKPSSDSSQVMNSDEIAALIANTDLLFESDSDDNKSKSPDLSDPGYIMNSDEIAALIANM